MKNVQNTNLQVNLDFAATKSTIRLQKEWPVHFLIKCVVAKLYRIATKIKFKFQQLANNKF